MSGDILAVKTWHLVGRDRNAALYLTRPRPVPRKNYLAHSSNSVR